MFLYESSTNKPVYFVYFIYYKKYTYLLFTKQKNDSHLY